MDKTNNLKKFDSITSIYKFLNKSKYFCLKYSLKRKCNSCSYYIQLEEFFNLYILINIEKLSIYDNLNDIINSIFIIDDCISPMYGLSLSDIRIPLKERKKLSSLVT